MNSQGNSNDNSSSTGEPSFHEKMAAAQEYWDGQLAIYGEEALFEQENSQYKDFIRYRNYYRTRVKAGETVQEYNLRLKHQFDNPLPLYGNGALWYEIGPYEGKNIGPVNFITKSPNNEDFLLTGGEHGGLFYSEDGGEHWENGGTDHLTEQISAADAQISPFDDDTWFFMDGNGEDDVHSVSGNSDDGYLEITHSVKTATITGVYRTTDQGNNWTQIGDKNFSIGTESSLYRPNNEYNEKKLGWTYDEWSMKKMLIDPNSSPNNLILFITTSTGLYRTQNAMANEVVWEKVFGVADMLSPIDNQLVDPNALNENDRTQCWIYKIIWIPNTSSSTGGLFLATTMKVIKDDNGFHYGSSIIYSETGLANSWQEWSVPIADTPSSYSVYDPETEENINVPYVNSSPTLKIDIAFSEANPNILYAQIQSKFDSEGGTHNHFKILKGYINNIPSAVNWIDLYGGVNSSYTAIAVNPTNENQVFFTNGLSIRKLQNGINQNASYYGHADHEDLLFRANGDLYICSHGGVRLLPNNGTPSSAEWKNDGLGVAQVKGFASSFSNPETVAVALWHDHTHATNNQEYNDNWHPTWKHNLLTGDCFDPDINYTDNRLIYTRNQYAKYTKTFLNFPNSAPQETQKPLSTGNSAGFCNGGTCLNYFNYNTLYTNWHRNNDEEYVFRHANKGGTASSDDWRIILNLRDDQSIHPMLAELITSELGQTIENSMVRLRSVYASKTNKNLIFASFYIDSPLGRTHHLAMTNKAQLGISGNSNTIADYQIDEINNSWILLNNPISNMEKPEYSGIFSWVSQIESDPLNPNIFYMVSGGIKRFTYNGDILNDDLNPDAISVENIPFAVDENNKEYDINSIYIMPGTQDIFIGTGLGVYHSTIQQINQHLQDPLNYPIEETWTKYGANIPNADVTEIEPNFVADKLRAATFGRGVWEIPLPCDKLDEAFVVPAGTDMTIDNYARFRQDVVVEDGATLTLTPQAKVYFAEHCALKVKPGGLLIVDGALLSNACGDALWLGISVEGQADLPQTAANQGKAIIKNGAIIENAHTGVWLRANTGVCTEVLESGGGIVFARNSTFKNCYVGIGFSPYRDYLSNNNPKSNVSYVRECHFLTTRTLNGGFEAKAGISLKEINKLYIKGNTFENTKTTPNNHPLYTGIGILSANSTFSATDYCSIPLPAGTTCPSNQTTRNTFINLVHGVRAYAWDEINTFTVDHALFDKCAYGLFAKKVHYEKITNCDFDVSPDPTTTGSLPWTPYGAHLLGCGNYEVEENNFYSDDNSYERVGIVIEHSYDISNQIYRNNFDDLYAGTIAQGDNRIDDDPFEGFEALCGVYNNNKYDISFTNNSKVAIFQGTDYNDPATPEDDRYSPANLFNTNVGDCSDENALHLNSGADPFNYYYLPGEYDFPNNTSCFTQSINDIPITGGIAFAYDQSCPSHLNSTGDVELKKGLVEQKRAEIVVLKNQIQNIENGGNDEQSLLNYINNTNNNSYAVRNELYPLSPNLSDDVLIALIHRNPAMGQWDLTELLIANSPLSLLVMEDYYMNVPLSSFYHSLLLMYQDGESMLTEIRKNIKTKKVVKTRAGNDYIRAMLLDMEEIADYGKIDELLGVEEDNETIKMKISLASAKGDFIAAQDYLNAYQPLSDKDAYAAFQTVLLEVKGQPEKFCELTDGQKNSLQSIIDNDKDQRYAAQNILEYANDQSFDELVVLPSGGNKSMKVQQDTEIMEIALMGIYPNPADKEVFFTFSYPQDVTNAVLSIYDANGRLMDKIDLAKYKGIYRLDITDWANGIYYSKLEVQGKLLADKKFTKL